MSFSNDERRRVEEDERYRIHSREQHALRRDREDREQAKKDEHRRRFVASHGEGAFYKILLKWMAGAVIWAILSFFSAIDDEGFFKAVGLALINFAVITGIGAARAYYVVNSAR